MSLWVEVNDKMQYGYRYERVCEEGKNFSADFEPQLTPKQMLEMGVFGGKYMTDCRNEFPSSWFQNAKLSPEGKQADMNYYGVLAGKPLSYWKAKGWIYKDDPRGWFQWYCRYYSGRRIEGEDERQIKRWKQMRRHLAQLRKIVTPMIFSVVRASVRHFCNGPIFVIKDYFNPASIKLAVYAMATNLATLAAVVYGME
ncbi:unnamed protein product [Bartonella apis]